MIGFPNLYEFPENFQNLIHRGKGFRFKIQNLKLDIQIPPWQGWARGWATSWGERVRYRTEDRLKCTFYIKFHWMISEFIKVTSLLFCSIPAAWKLELGVNSWKNHTFHPFSFQYIAESEISKISLKSCQKANFQLVFSRKSGDRNIRTCRWLWMGLFMGLFWDNWGEVWASPTSNQLFTSLSSFLLKIPCFLLKILFQNEISFV